MGVACGWLPRAALKCYAFFRFYGFSWKALEGFRPPRATTKDPAALYSLLGVSLSYRDHGVKWASWLTLM